MATAQTDLLIQRCHKRQFHIKASIKNVLKRKTATIRRLVDLFLLKLCQTTTVVSLEENIDFVATP